MEVALESASQDPTGSGAAPEGRLSSTPVHRSGGAVERDAGGLTWLVFALILALVLLATGWIAFQLT